MSFVDSPMHDCLLTELVDSAMHDRKCDRVKWVDTCHDAVVSNNSHILVYNTLTQQ